MMSLHRPTLILAFLLLTLAFCVGAVAASPPTLPDADRRMQGAYRRDRNVWIYVHLQGAPEQIGCQDGRLLAPEIDDFLRVIKPYFKKSTGRGWEF
jgi:hypothetical protein